MTDSAIPSRSYNWLALARTPFGLAFLRSPLAIQEVPHEVAASVANLFPVCRRCFIWLWSFRDQDGSTSDAGKLYLCCQQQPGQHFYVPDRSSLRTVVPGRHNANGPLRGAALSGDAPKQDLSSCL